MTSSVISFAYFTHFSNLNISGTTADICKQYTAFSFFHGTLRDTLKTSRGKNWIIVPLKSAYEVKNNCCLFERLFKVKKNGVFLFGILFLFLEICTFLYYANEDSDDVIGGSIKTV